MRKIDIWQNRRGHLVFLIRHNVKAIFEKEDKS